MRPNLTVIIVTLALIFSVVAGIYLGGDWRVWLAQPEGNTGVNENTTLPLAPPTPTVPVE